MGVIRVAIGRADDKPPGPTRMPPQTLALAQDYHQPCRPWAVHVAIMGLPALGGSQDFLLTLKDV